MARERIRNNGVRVKDLWGRNSEFEQNFAYDTDANGCEIGEEQKEEIKAWKWIKQLPILSKFGLWFISVGLWMKCK